MKPLRRLRPGEHHRTNAMNSIEDMHEAVYFTSRTRLVSHFDRIPQLTQSPKKILDTFRVGNPDISRLFVRTSGSWIVSHTNSQNMLTD